MRTETSSPTVPRAPRAILFLVVCLAFLPVLQADFQVLDDEIYVTANPHVLGGLSWENIRAAFTTFHSANYHPLTWLSHQLDVTLFGLAPWGHHLTSLTLHAASALLLVLALARLTGAFWPAFLVAALWALHPLRVESVAWVAERKDLLSALFGSLALHAYAGYARRPGLIRMLAVTLWMAASLLSKPTLVTLPCLLLLLDVWPLKRTHLRGGGETPWLRLVLEKWPLWLLTAASCLVTVLAQGQGGAFGGLGHLTLAERAVNALTAVGAYLLDTLWPVGLAPFYPMPGNVLGQWPWALGSAAAVLLLLAGSLWRFRRAPAFAIGLCWFLGTLVPVIGLVQVGFQARADRYTLIPSVGLALALVYGFSQLWEQREQLKRSAAWAALGCCIVLAALSFRQSMHWENTLRLYAHADEVTRDNCVARMLAGEELAKLDRQTEAAKYFKGAVQCPYTARGAYLGLGRALRAEGAYDQASEAFQAILNVNRGDPDALAGLALTRFEAGDPAAVKLLEAALAANPPGGRTEPRRWLDLALRLGAAYGSTGQLTAAEAVFTRVLEFFPGNGAAQGNLERVRALRRERGE